MTKQVGRAIPHESARAHVTGSAKYVDDLCAQVAQLVHAFPVCAPYAHARVLTLEVDDALREPSVLHVLTAADVPGENDTGPVRHDEPLFPREVQHHGQAVAWVLAESEEAARRGARRVRVSYEQLPAILDIQAAIAAESFLTEAQRMATGDTEQALNEAPCSLSGELALNGQEHFYLETQAALATYDASDAMEVHSSTQHPTETQEVVARVLGLAKHQVNVQCLRMGGAFGGKETQANTWAAIAALGAHTLRRPVRVRLTRAQDMTMTGKRHPFWASYRVGFDRTGRLLALSLRLFSDGGYSLDLSLPIMMRAMFHVDNCYRIPNLEVIGRVCRTHHVSHTAFRGFGGPQGMVVIEEVIARVAQALALPAHLVRARNFYQEGDSTHYGQLVRDAGRITRIYEELSEESALSARLLEIEAHNRSSTQHKRGIALTPVKFGISFTTAFFNQASALVLIFKDGSVQVNHGGTEMGQGLHTKMQQIAADALGLPLSAIRLMPTRTDKVPNTSATAASSGSDLNGAAVRAACDTLRQRLTEVASRMLNVPSEQIHFADGKVHSGTSEGETLSFAALVAQAYLERVQLVATGFYKTPDIHFDAASGRGKPFHYFAYGAAVSEVEVDALTGQYRLLRVDILHDVGDSLSPLVDLGQIEGGFIQGLGWLTCEELVFNAEGKLATQGASTYKLPSLGECPPIFNVRCLTRAREEGVVHGSKAVGEPPLMLAISVREALRAAVSAFGAEFCSRADPRASTKFAELACPATPEAVYWAIEKVRAHERAV
jgi:xanthine dehydrogenase large subunit